MKLTKRDAPFSKKFDKRDAPLPKKFEGVSLFIKIFENRASLLVVLWYVV